MISNRSRAAATRCILLLIFALIGCGTEVSVTADQEIVAVSQSVFVKAESSSIDDTTFFWQSSDPAILKVNSPGTGVAAWGLSPGTVEVTAEGTATGAIGRITLSVVDKADMPADKPRTVADDFVEAARDGEVYTVLRLIAEGVDIDYQQERTGNMSALIAASRGQHEEIVTQLIDADADPDLQDINGITALIGAVYHPNIPIIEALLAHGADPNLTDTSGRSVLDFALEGNGRAAFSVLVAGGAREAQSHNAKLLLKHEIQAKYGDKIRYAFLIIWCIACVISLLPVSAFQIFSPKLRYYKIPSGEEVTYVEMNGVNDSIKRTVQVLPSSPSLFTRKRDDTFFELPENSESIRALEFHQAWHEPYETYKRWVLFLRLCAYTVLSLPLFAVWGIIADHPYVGSIVREYVLREAVFLLWFVCFLIPWLCAATALVAFIRLQLKIPSTRQQIVAVVSGACVLAGLVGMVSILLDVLRGISS